MDNSNSTFRQLLDELFGSLLKQRNLVLGVILLVALLGFEMFNFSTTQFALQDLLGDIRFAGLRWATILALAFCGIDFAGIAKMFTSDDTDSNPREVWFLFGAWLLAATLNATLTWWGVAMALANHSLMSAVVIDPGVLLKAVPIFVAIVVWVTRILLISSISSAGARFGVTENATQPVRRDDSYAGSYDRPRTTQPLTARPASSRSATITPPPPARADRPTSHRPRHTQEETLPEPEYIPDPSYSPAPAAFHSLSTKGSRSDSSVRK